LRTLARQGHFGLAGAVERVEAIGGKLEVDSAPGKGTRLRVTVSLVR
jgi:signal transduction histidine kinase